MLFAIELGVHRAVHVGGPDAGFDVPRAEQALDARWIVNVEVAPVTLETFDPLVVQVDAAMMIVTVSGLVPLFCSGGSNVTVPLPEQVMLPVATVGALVDEVVDELLDVELLVVDVELFGLEEHAASPSDSAKPTRRSLEMR